MSRKALTLTIPMPALADLADLSAGLRALPRGVLRGLLRWQGRAHERVQLLAMDERMRRDMGISHAQQLREGHKPFWRP